MSIAYWETEVRWRSKQLDHLRQCETVLREHSQEEGERAARAVQIAEQRLEEARDFLRGEQYAFKRRCASRDVARYLDEADWSEASR